MRHIVSAGDLSPSELLALFERAKFHKDGNVVPAHPLSGCIMVSLFYQPSTRTRLSFESAMHRLGGQVISTENAREFSSEAKGETLEDTINVLGAYAHLIVLRHHENGAAERAARVSRVSLVNAGDGTNQHPTQAFLDLFTIWEAARGRLPKRPLRILFFGDNQRSRTVNSLAQLLATHAPHLGFKIGDATFVGTRELGQPKPETVSMLRQARIPVRSLREDWDEDYDIVYVTRSQKEYGDGKRERGDVLVFEPGRVLPSHAIVMHPLPRTSELPTAFDHDERAWYFKQSDNGVPVRMALLEMLLE